MRNQSWWYSAHDLSGQLWSWAHMLTLLTFLCWPLYYMSLYLGLLITPVLSSNLSSQSYADTKMLVIYLGIASLASYVLFHQKRCPNTINSFNIHGIVILFICYLCFWFLIIIEIIIFEEKKEKIHLKLKYVDNYK